MTWVRDCQERVVNIDNFDVLDCTNITDLNTNECVAMKVFLCRGQEELVLGYVPVKNICYMELIEQIVKGVEIDFENLEDVLYWHVIREEVDKVAEQENWGDDFKVYYAKKVLFI